MVANNDVERFQIIPEDSVKRQYLLQLLVMITAKYIIDKGNVTGRYLKAEEPSDV